MGCVRLSSTWRWVILAVFINFLSIVARSVAWQLTIDQALPEPHPRNSHVFSAFCVGLLGNAVLPARAGELARVAVLRRHLPDHGEGTTATLVGTVFAHRLFDLPAVALLVVYVLLTAKIPHWAVTSLVIFGLVGARAPRRRDALGARRLDHRMPSLEDAGSGPPASSRWRGKGSACSARRSPQLQRSSFSSSAGSSSSSPSGR